MKILNLIALCTCLAFGGEFDLNAANGAVTNLTPLKKAGQIAIQLQVLTMIRRAKVFWSAH